MAAPALDTVQSPCLKVCTLNPADGLCRGCGRTLSEIANWVAMTAEERAAVMAQLPARLAAQQAKG
ncbi:MAG: DUF1289 domain-containing protein [Pseudolabrys sp.]|nr:DUF1289 domain-containing protein [Pseudolabrys sp.]MBV9953630.1 DUF1289 domain-containing protein [Pseudolabrys sp.]